MLDFDPNILPNQRALDDAHERGFRTFLSSIGHDARRNSHCERASDALIDLPVDLKGSGVPSYGDPYVVAAYLVHYHLSHCALAYWSFKRLFSRVGVPDALYICDVGAGTGAGRVGLGMALNEHPARVKVYFDAFEPSAKMLQAGASFWKSFRKAVADDLDSDYREFQHCPTKLPSFPKDALRLVTAFHLSLPYNSDRSLHPFMHRYARSRSLSPAQQSLQSALNFVKPNAGIFTCHTNKENSLRQAVDSFPGWNGKAAPIAILKDDGVGTRSGFYTNCAENLGFTVPGSERSPVRTWSRYRFSLPDGVLLLRTAPNRAELLRRERERIAEEERQSERERQRRIEIDERIRKEQAEQEERQRKRRIEAERLAAARAEAERQRREEERKRQEALDQLWATLDSYQESGEVISAEVVGTNSGGLRVVWEGLFGFVPFSHCRDIASRDDSDALARLTGQSFDFNVLEIDRAKNDFKLTRATIIKQAAWDTLEKDQIIDGIVIRTTSFGAFVRVAGSIEGLVHISQLSPEWVSVVEDVVTEGQSVKVRVLGVEIEKNRLSLSIKDASPNPWDDIDSFLRIGDKRTGQVQRIEENKRLVVDIGDRLQGRIHVSQLGNREIGSFHPGDELLVEVLTIDPANRLIWLKAAEHWSV